MKTVLTCLVSAFSLIAVPCGAIAQDSSSSVEEIGVVRLRVNSHCLDKSVRRALDSLVPRLAALEPRRIVKIEAYAGWGTSREESIRNSLLLALEAQRYLRNKLGNAPNLFITAAPDLENGKSAVVRVVTFPDSFAAVHVSSATSREPHVR